MKRIDKGRLLEVSESSFSYTREHGKTGWKSLGLSLATSHGTGKGGFEYYMVTGDDCLRECAASEIDGGLQLQGRYRTPGLEETVRLRFLKNGALRLDRRIHNTGVHSHVIRGAAAGGAAGGGPVFRDNHIWRARFAHMDNVRTDQFPWCRPEYPYVRPIPKTKTRFGAQETQPVPAMILTNDTYSELLLEGQLRQDRTRACWELCAGAGQIVDHYSVQWGMPQGGFEIAPGAVLELEPFYFEIFENTAPDHCWDGYRHAVIEENDLEGVTNSLQSQAFYCSWNYGVFHDISEEKLMRTARFVAAEMPAIRFFLIDGGWQSSEPVMCPSCANFHLPEAEWHHAERFPNGLKVMADRIRQTGLRPAIWWSPGVGLHSRLALEHPEWLAKDASGNVYRIGDSGYLDYSLPPVQKYLRRIFEILFEKWGFEGMKMDFWSQSVESDTIRYATGTGIQWRDWLLDTIRSYMPDDGFLMTCVAAAMGNPFLGKAAQTYRCSIDVGACRWPDHVASCVWNLPLHAWTSPSLILPNVDGIGWSREMTDNENMHRLTYAFITMGSLEVDGRLEELPADAIKRLNRMLADMDRGHTVHCLDRGAFCGTPLPSCLYVRYPEESRTRRRGVAMHVALFNWKDTPECAGVTTSALGIDNETLRGTDFWSGEPVEFREGALSLLLPPRSARLFEFPDLIRK